MCKVFLFILTSWWLCVFFVLLILFACALPGWCWSDQIWPADVTWVPDFLPFHQYSAQFRLFCNIYFCGFHLILQGHAHLLPDICLMINRDVKRFKLLVKLNLILYSCPVTLLLLHVPFHSWSKQTEASVKQQGSNFIFCSKSICSLLCFCCQSDYICLTWEGIFWEIICTCCAQHPQNLVLKHNWNVIWCDDELSPEKSDTGL